MNKNKRSAKTKAHTHVTICATTIAYQTDGRAIDISTDGFEVHGGLKAAQQTTGDFLRVELKAGTSEEDAVKALLEIAATIQTRGLPVWHVKVPRHVAATLRKMSEVPEVLDRELSKLPKQERTRIDAWIIGQSGGMALTKGSRHV